MNYTEKARLVKEASLQLGASPADLRNRALEAIAEALTADKETIFTANRMDLEAGKDLPRR